LGLTLICSTISGQPAPTINELSTSSTNPIAGMRRSRRNSAENTAAAQIRRWPTGSAWRQHRVDVGVAGAGERLAARVC
jgi:hypothetical protein